MGPDGILHPLEIILDIERRSRVVVHTLEHIRLVLGEMEPCNVAFSLISNGHRQSQEVHPFQLLGISGWPEYSMFLDHRLKVSIVPPSTPTPLTLLL